MVTIDCPWCLEPVAQDGLERFRCGDCGVDAEIDPDPAIAAEVAA